ncbi:MAG TPA: hypothetical protein PKH96_14830, partial [Gemmatimonadaceae bacterium]|nr:hypothetical protein [Gemmatimonadaceae bacterium]
MSTPLISYRLALLLVCSALPISRGIAMPSTAPSGDGRKASATPDSVALIVTRLTGQAGEALVSSAIPLRRGAIRPDAVSGARLVVDGAPVDAAIEGTTGLHADGSLRSVVVQFRTVLRPGDRVTAWLIWGRSPTGPRRAQLLDIPPYPEAVALPTSA